MIAMDRPTVPAVCQGCGNQVVDPADHLCSDYLDWHRTTPDRRDVDTMDVTVGGWTSAAKVRSS